MKTWIHSIGVGAVAIAATMTLFTGSAVADAAKDLMSRPIKVVHGSNPGAPQDVMMRFLAEQINRVTGANVIVEPRPGGTSTVAVSHMMGQSADGHTVFLGGSGVVQSLQMPSAPYKINGIRPAYRIQLDPFALYVKRDGKYGDMKALVADMKANPKKIRIGGFGNGSGQHLAALNWAEKAGVEMTWVPFNSGSKSITAVMGDNLDAALSNLGVYNRFKDKTIIVGMSAGNRIPEVPEVPTFKDGGYDVTVTHWRSLFVRKDTPTEVVTALNELVGKGVKTKEFQDYLKKSGTQDGSLTVKEFEDWLGGQIKFAHDQLKKNNFIN